MNDDQPITPANAGAEPSGSAAEQLPGIQPPSRLKRIIKRFGVAGFLFFLIKGVVLYILIPLGLFKWFGGC